MPSQKTSGTQTTVIDTLHTLATVTDAGVYVLALDFFDGVAGDIYEVDVLLKVLTGGTARKYLPTAIYSIISLASPVVLSIPVPVLWGVIFKLQQTDGVTSDIAWEVIQLDA